MDRAALTALGIRRRVSLCAFLLAIAYCLLPIASHVSEAAQILNGTLADLTGDVKIRRAGSDLDRQVSSGTRVDPGDAIFTGASGRASIKFEHGKIELGSATRVTILRAMTSRDEVFAELALTAGAVEAYINMEKTKELWFDILTPTQRARGVGSKKNATRLTVSHDAGGVTSTDSEVGRWQYQPIILTDMPPAVQAVLTENAKASTMMKTYIDTALSQSALTAYEVTANSGAPDIGAVAVTAPVIPEAPPTPTATNDVGPTEVSSGPVKVKPAALKNKSKPPITGDPKPGSTLTCNPGGWSGEPTFTYEWFLDGQPISNTTGKTYKPTEDDAGKKITCKVTAKEGGEQVEATSDPVTVPLQKPPEVPRTPLSLTISVGADDGEVTSSSSTVTTDEDK